MKPAALAVLALTLIVSSVGCCCLHGSGCPPYGAYYGGGGGGCPGGNCPPSVVPQGAYLQSQGVQAAQAPIIVGPATAAAPAPAYTTNYVPQTASLPTYGN